MTDIGSSTGNSESSTITLTALRGEAVQRLAAVQERLEAKGVGAAFIRAAKADPIGDVGFMGSLLFHAILAGGIADFFDLDLSGLSTEFNAALAVGGMEGAAALRDGQTHAAVRDKKKQMGSLYPEGRRKTTGKEKGPAKRGFNRAAANQNNRFSYDVQTELACMFEIIDTIDWLEKQGVKEVRVGKRLSTNAGLRKLMSETAQAVAQPTNLRMAI